MSWIEWVALIADNNITAKQYGKAFGVSESKARAKLKQAERAGHLTCKRQGMSVVYRVRRVHINDGDFARFCGHNIQHLHTLPDVCQELPSIFLIAITEVAEVQELKDRTVYTVETKASEEVASLAVSNGVKSEADGDKLLIIVRQEKWLKT